MRTIQSLAMLAAAGVLSHTASAFLQPVPGASALSRYVPHDVHLYVHTTD